MEEMYIFSIRVIRVMLEHAFRYIVKNAATLHDHDAGCDLVSFISRSEFLYCKSSQTMHAHSGHCNVSSPIKISVWVKPMRLSGGPGIIMHTGTTHRA